MSEQHRRGRWPQRRRLQLATRSLQYLCGCPSHLARKEGGQVHPDVLGIGWVICAHISADFLCNLKEVFVLLMPSLMKHDLKQSCSWNQIRSLVNDSHNPRAKSAHRPAMRRQRIHGASPPCLWLGGCGCCQICTNPRYTSVASWQSSRRHSDCCARLEMLQIFSCMCWSASVAPQCAACKRTTWNPSIRLGLLRTTIECGTDTVGGDVLSMNEAFKCLAHHTWERERDRKSACGCVRGYQGLERTNDLTILHAFGRLDA